LPWRSRFKAGYLERLVTANAETAKEAFAKAVEWHVAKRFRGVSISDGHKSFTIAEFAWTMASQEIADTACAAAQRLPVLD
jgi:hypothetical protein